MSLKLRPDITEAIHVHLRSAYPEEGCGVLLGRDRDATREVEVAMGVANRREESRHNRYLLDPEQVLAAEQAGRARGLDLVGFFHSHPDHPAEPSSFDLEHAWPFYSYVIAAVRGGEVAELRSWRLTEDRSRFEPETIEHAAESQASRRDETTETR